LLAASFKDHLLDVKREFAALQATHVHQMRKQTEREHALGVMPAYATAPPGEDDLQVVIQMPHEDVRHAQLRDLERQMTDVHAVFARMAEQIAAHGELIHRIEDNLVEADAHAHTALEQLQTYYRSMSSDRWLIGKLFAVLLIAIIFFVVFLL
jgi:hypothetical protein